MSEKTALTETPEFKEAVAKATAEAFQALIAKHGAPNNASDQSFIGGLALQLAELTGQGSGRVYVAPEVLRQRDEARERMVQLIIDARKQKKPATYRMTGKSHLADRVVEPMWVGSDHTTHSTEIDYDEIPNEAMVPVNDVAKEIHAAFMASIGNLERVVPEDALGITHRGLVVRNRAITNAIARATPATGNESEQADTGLRLHHQNAPGRYVEKNILGTIAQPARQSA